MLLSEKIAYFFIILFISSHLFNGFFPNNAYEPLVFVFACCGFLMLIIARFRRNAVQRNVRTIITAEMMLFYWVVSFVCFLILYCLFSNVLLNVGMIISFFASLVTFIFLRMKQTNYDHKLRMK